MILIVSVHYHVMKSAQGGETTRGDPFAEGRVDKAAIASELKGVLDRAHISWRENDLRDMESGTGWKLSFRDGYDSAQPGEPRVYEEFGYWYQNDHPEFTYHRYMVSVMEGESPDGKSSDLMTTFGIEPLLGTLRVFQVSSPGRAQWTDLATLQSHRLYGIQDSSEEVQWATLEDLVCTARPDRLTELQTAS